jgi:hypothetical protein
MAAAASSTEVFRVERSGVTESRSHKVRAMARREALARYLASDDGAAPSNYEAMVRALERDPNAGAMPCEDCDGLGFRKLAKHVVDAFDQKLENRLHEVEHKTRLMRDALAEAQRPRPEGDDIEERLRRMAADEADRLKGEIIELYENIDTAKRERRKLAACRTCKGSARSRRRKRQDKPGRPDSMFSTTACPRCIGRDARRHPSLLHTHTGTSSGEARMRGPRAVLYTPGDPNCYEVVSDPRDDAAAELGDVCKRCVVEEGTPGYIAPITCRPTLRAADVEEETQGTEETAENRSEDDFDPGGFRPVITEGPPGHEDAASWLEEVAAEDSVLAVAIALLAGDKADRECVLWPLVTAGLGLAQGCPAYRQGDGYELLLAHCEAETQAEQEATVGSPRRRLLLGHARHEARRLKERAEARLGA